jgi:hypothetical protein
MRKVSYLISVAAFMLAGMHTASAQSLTHCFTINQFDGWWRADGDKTLYIRTGAARYYRLDLVQQCGLADFPDAHLIFQVHGSDTICSRLDFDLRISQGMGDIPRPCFVKQMSEVPPSDVAALRNHGK